MTNTDVSVVLNMHKEALFLAPTLNSLAQCALTAKERGIVVELIAVFDRSDDATRHAFRAHELSAFSRVEEVEVDVGSLGLARNAGVERARGEYVWTSDADDLVSSNSIVALLDTARAHGGSKVAVFLEYLCAFGEQYHNVRYVDSRYLTAADFAFQHPYVSRIFLSRAAFDDMQYHDLRVTSGFAYEDWYFNCQLRAAGYEMVVAPDTVIFYRQRAGSLLRQANAASVRLIPHSKLFDVPVFLSDMRDTRKRVGDWDGFLAKRAEIFHCDNTRKFMESETLQEFLWDAIRLEPEIEPNRVEVAGSYSPMPWNPDHWGLQLENMYKMIGDDHFTDVVLLPWLNQGGAEKYILQVLNEIADQEPGARFLVLSGEPTRRNDWVSKLPKNSVFMDVFNTFPRLDAADRDALTIRMLLAVCGAGARLHVKSSAFAHRLLDSYSPVLSQAFRIVYYRFSDGTYQWRGSVLRGPWGAGVLRRHLAGFWRVLTDCNAIVEADRRFLGPVPAYHTVYARCDGIEGVATSSVGLRRKLLWASRVAEEKRPQILALIAEGLAKRGLDVAVDAYGTAGQGVDPREVFSTKAGNISYRGPFMSSSELPVRDYDAFVYTTAFDGLPNILLEMLGSGLPVIAPDVGGIGEVVHDGVTGVLIQATNDDSALVDAYVEAIASLYDGTRDVPRMVEAGKQLIATRHGTDAFAHRVGTVLSLTSEDCSKVD